MFWGWGVGFWFDIRCYIVLYYYIIHILLLNLISYYYTTILYIIIYYSYYYTILFLLFFFLPNILYNPLLILSLLPSPILPFLILPSIPIFPNSYLWILKGIHIYLMVKGIHIYQFKVYVSGLPSPYLCSSNILFLYNPQFSSQSIILYVSVFIVGYLYLRLISQSDNLTPHVLSEWMVEVCRFY